MSFEIYSSQVKCVVKQDDVVRTCMTFLEQVCSMLTHMYGNYVAP